MAKNELGISFRSEPDERVLKAIVKAVSEYPFSVISIYEDLGDQPPTYPLFAFAKKHQTARLGAACLVVPKYPTMDSIVGDISRLDSLAPGRAYLGLVAGAWMENIGLKAAPIARMREAVEVSRYLLEKKEEGYEGKFYKVKAGFKVNYKTPENKVPLLLGAWGEKMTVLAGEVADEIKVGGSSNPCMIKVMKNRLAVGASRAERRVSDIGVVLGAVTVISESREEALNYARQKAALYINEVGSKDPTSMLDFPDEIRAIKAAVNMGNVEEAVKHMPDALAKRFMFAGNPQDIIKQTEEIFNAGGNRVEFGTPHGLNEIEGIHLLGKKVLPYFK